MDAKLDLSMAYERVYLEFLGYMINRMGYDPLFMEWIIKCICSTSFSFNINGLASGYVIISRGVRQ